MTFLVAKSKEIVGHTLQREQLLSDLQSDNVAHAYLFSGNKHLGKFSFAKWMARELLLDGVPVDAQKKTLSDIERLVHPDILVLDQLWMEDVCEDWEVISKSSNVPQQNRAKAPAAKTDTISIDDIRAVQNRLYETGIGKWRCCLIRSVERMQDPAANAFLKILEEPPKRLVFLLTTQALSSLLPTVVSRTRVMHFSRLTQPEILPLLKGTDTEEANVIQHFAQGAPGLVVHLRDDADALRDQRLLHGKANSFWKSHSLRERLQLLTPLYERGEESEQYLIHLSLTLREQSPDTLQRQLPALLDLVEALKTNAHRQLLCQSFALRVTPTKTITRV